MKRTIEPSGGSTSAPIASGPAKPSLRATDHGDAATVGGITDSGVEQPILVGSLDAPGEPGALVAQADSPAVYSQGHLLYLRENIVMAQPFDVTRLETTGEAVPLAEQIPTFTTGSRIPGFAVSATGLLVYQTGGAGTKKSLTWKDRQGNVLGTLGDLRTLDGQVKLSSDGKRAAITDLIAPMAIRIFGFTTSTVAFLPG